MCCCNNTQRFQTLFTILCARKSVYNRICAILKYRNIRVSMLYSLWKHYSFPHTVAVPPMITQHSSQPLTHVYGHGTLPASLQTVPNVGRAVYFQTHTWIQGPQQPFFSVAMRFSCHKLLCLPTRSYQVQVLLCEVKIGGASY